MSIRPVNRPIETPLPDGRVLVEYTALGSTQDAARELVLAGRRDVAGVRARYQAAGRGRRGAAWIAPADTCLLVTYIVADVAPETVRALPFAAGVAVAQAVEHVSGVRTALKWPNDVQVGGKKLAGILVETLPALSDVPVAALVGIGINANVDVFPGALASTATSVRMERGEPVSVAELERAVREELFALAIRPWSDVMALWRARDCTPGCRFRAWVDGREIEGAAQGVTDDGSLLLRLPDGTLRPVVAATSAAR